MKKVKFVVLSSPRSGSTVFRLWLNSHRNIRCHDEVLAKQLDALDSIHHYFELTRKNDVNRYKYDRNVLGHPDDEFTINLLRDFLKDLFENRDRCGAWTTPENINEFHPMTDFDETTAVGFKLMTYSLGNIFLNQWLTREPVRIIHLIRHNSLKQLISSEVAKKRKVWFSDTPHEPTTIHLDTNMLKPFLSGMEEMNAGIQKRFAGQYYMRASYEEFCSSPDELAQKVCNFIAVPDAELRMPTLKKLNPLNVSDIVDNYAEVRNTLAGTRFEKFLDESGTTT